MNRKAMAAALAVCTLLTGCSGGGDSSSASSGISAVHTENDTSGSSKNERTVITAASFGSSIDFDYFTDKYNRSQSKYKVKKVDYSKYSDEDDIRGDGALEQMKRDIITGDAPDVIVLGNHGTVDLLSKKGAFADLSEFMENDPDVNRETLMPNVLKALEGPDGCLYSIAPQFYVMSMAVKSKFGQRENWSVDEMMEFYDNAPATADRLYAGIERDDVFDAIISGMDELVDYDNAKCFFDSSDFVKALEFCSRFVVNEDVPGKETPYENAAYYADKATWLKTDRNLLDMFRFEGSATTTMNDYSYAKYIDFADDITLVGYPSSSGHGGKLVIPEEFSITSTCSDKEGAWDFIRWFFSKEVQAIPDMNESSNVRHAVRYMRARKDCFEDWLNTCRYFKTFNEAGDALIKTYSSEKMGETAYPFTDEEVDYIRRYILSCDTLYGAFDREITDICREEAAAYFAGDRSAQQTADLIQNRVSILLSEQS